MPFIQISILEKHMKSDEVQEFRDSSIDSRVSIISTSIATRHDSNHKAFMNQWAARVTFRMKSKSLTIEHYICLNSEQ